MAQLGNTAMSGTNVKDDLEVNLLTGATLTAAGTTNSTAVTVDRPGNVAFVLELGAVTGTTPTLTLTVQGSDDAAFGAGTVVALATVASSGTTDDNFVYAQSARVYKKYVRVVTVLGGTNPVYTGATLKMRPPHWQRTASRSAATLV